MPKPISGMSDDEKKELQSQLAELIRAAVVRIHYAEGRKTTFLAIGAALVASGVALFTASISKVPESIIWYAALICAVSLALSGIILWFVYARQTNRYPWTSATRTWKWFYRDALPRQADFDLSIWQYFWGWKNLKTKTQHAFTKQLEEFSKGKILSLSNKDIAIEQDIEQLYVLHVNDKYKNLHLSHLQKILFGGISCALILTFTSVAGLTAYKLRSPASTRSHFETSDVRVDVVWRVAKPVPMSGDVASRVILFSAAIYNIGKGSILLGPPYLADSEGILLPYEQLKLATELTTVPPSGAATVAGSLKVGSDIASEIKTVGVFFVKK
jgi:hypothetical protein